MCTGIQLIAEDTSVVFARTLEFGIQVDTDINVIPRNYELWGTNPDESKGLIYTTKYAAVGATAYKETIIFDGVNEKGLAAGSFYFPDYASYSEITSKNIGKALAPVEYTTWLLTQFATVDEVKEHINDAVIAPTIFKHWNEVPPFHYIVHDKTGKSIVIEPVGGKLVVYDNPVKVITNSPTFDWHLTNLRNYINLSALNVAPVTLDEVEFKQFGQGTGLLGLPGDFTPPSRFVRAVVFSKTALQEKDADDTVLKAFHILNNFDIPIGSVRAMEDDVIHTEFTMFTAASDLANSRYYFKTYDDQTIKMVDLREYGFDAKEIKLIEIDSEQPIIKLSPASV